MATTGSGPHVGKVLELKSPFGEESITYKWPLKKGKGSVRRSEDEEDEAGEILETIRWVCTDHPDIEEILDKTGALAGSKYDPTSFDAMEALCNAYNKAVDKSLVNKKKTSWWPKPHPNFKTRCTRPHLKHILQKCYNKSVADPNLLNHYEAFTPEVYGETSFELICQILDKLHPISPENKFVDLGSGVGQVVLQVAALTDCEMSFGIEKANTPANYALVIYSNPLILLIHNVQC
jgi:H3 lysine-79-specific histone-lysine N-methyltransferase